ncbi:MAG: hypothetical protein J5I47_01145 [Vicingus serpentipes]|nr:hypothetical protein [Vicingus serpentipes]
MTIGSKHIIALGLKQFFAVSLLLQAVLLFSQNKEEDKNAVIEKRIEYLTENSEEGDVDYTTLFNQLAYYFNHPLDLNEVHFFELEELGLLTDIQINNFVEHRNKNGKLLAIEELQTIEGFDLTTIRLILPFVSLNNTEDYPSLSFKDLMKYGKQELIMRYQDVLEEKKGYSTISSQELAESPNSRYLGNSFKAYTRYRYHYGNRLSIGFVAEKDPGEEFFSGTQKKGFDFYSGHFFLRNQGKMKQLAIGDYQAQFGQGLTYWSGIAYGKSADIMLVKRSAAGLRPYTSVDENQFLRGGGVTLNQNNIEATLFYSYNTIDANIDSINDSSTPYIVTSIQNTGFHRTPGELEDKNVLLQQLAGGHLAYKTRKLNLGITGIYRELDVLFQPSLQPYSQFRNTKNYQSKLGVDYNWVYKNFNFFGEYAKSMYAGSAMVSGVIIALDPKLSLSILYRDYQRDFQPISSAGLGESSSTENEKGLYTGVIIQPVKKWTISAYYDQFTFPWLRYTVDAPSKGHQYLVQLTYQPSKRLEMYMRIRERIKEKNTPIDVDRIDYLVNEKQTNYRYHITYRISDNIQLKSRVEWVYYDLEESLPEIGYMIFQDVVYQPKNRLYSFSFRYALFDTPSYSSRIYAYENDVLYSFSIPAYYYRGTRTYFTLKYKLKKKLDVWLRYALTYYDNVDVISSGLEEIKGNHKQEIKAQVRLKF